MESNHRYYARRASEEFRAEARALTPEAKARRHALAESFMRQASLCGDEVVAELYASADA